MRRAGGSASVIYSRERSRDIGSVHGRYRWDHLVLSVSHCVLLSISRAWPGHGMMVASRARAVLLLLLRSVQDGVRASWVTAVLPGVVACACDGQLAG